MLYTRNLTKRYGGISAVSNLNLTVADREIVGIIGPNGAGKSTLLSLISGEIKATSGSIWFREKQISSLKPHEITTLGIARTYHRGHLFNTMTVEENVLIGARLRHHPNFLQNLFRTKVSSLKETEALEITDQLLEQTGLKDKKNCLPQDLSFFELKWLQLARILATEPRLILLDEALSGLNENQQEQFLQFLTNLHDHSNVSMVLTESRPEKVSGLCNRLYILEYGNCVAQGTLDEIRKSQQIIVSMSNEKDQDYSLFRYQL